MLRRVPIGPLLVAVASWCAAGLITVPDPNAAALRLAVPAPWWVPAAAFLLALSVPGFRRHPASALPALMSTLPWWPLPMPALALIWTGPLAWAPILAALLTALWPRPHDAPAAAGPSRRGPLLAGAATFGLAVAAALAVAPELPGGDEPHYLIITQSLLQDGDVDIGNNHEARDYAAYVDKDLSPDVIQRGRKGEAFSIHAPGVSAIVAPAFAIGGYRGAQLTVMSLAALTGALIWWLGWRVTGDRAAAWFAWGALAATPTFLIQSVTIFPDGPAALAAAAGVWLLVRLKGEATVPALSAVSLVGAALAILPWLHTRLSVLAAGLGLAIVWQLAANPRFASTHRTRHLLAFIAVPLLSAAAWFGYFYALYGTIDPTAPYGKSGADRSWAYVPGGLAGLLFDGQFGLLVYSPVLVMAVAGLRYAARTAQRPVVLATLAAALAYLGLTTTYWMWWAGVPAPPARFMMPLLPMLAIPLAIAWTRVDRAARGLALVALIASIGATVSLLAEGRGALAWNIRDGQSDWLNWLGPVVNLPRGWPSFFWRLTPGDVGSEGPFAIHVVAGVIVAVLAVRVILRLGRRALESGAPPLLVPVLGLLIGFAAVIQVGWMLNSTTGLDPARSQMATLEKIARGRSPVSLGAWRTPDAARTIRVRPEEAPRFRTDVPWAWFGRVPGGAYELHVRSDRPLAGELTARIGHPRPVLTAYPLAPVLDQTVTLSLPAGTNALAVEIDDGLKAAGATVELRRRGR